MPDIESPAQKGFQTLITYGSAFGGAGQYIESDVGKDGDSVVAALELVFRLGPVNKEASVRLNSFLDVNHSIYREKIAIYTSPIMFWSVKALEGAELDPRHYAYVKEMLISPHSRVQFVSALELLLTQTSECKAYYREIFLKFLDAPLKDEKIDFIRRDSKADQVPLSWVVVRLLLEGKEFHPTRKQMERILEIRSEKMPADLLQLIDGYSSRFMIPQTP